MRNRVISLCLSLVLILSMVGCGNKEVVKSLSSIHLSECDFTLSLTKEYSKFLDNLYTGYLYKGTKYL